MDDRIRVLSDTERAIITPLLHRRASLEKELSAVNEGLSAVLHAFAGEVCDVTLDGETWTLRRLPSVEDAADRIRAMGDAS